MDFLRRSVFRNSTIDRDVEWQPQQLHGSSQQHPTMDETSPRRRFSSLFTTRPHNNNNGNISSSNPYAVPTNFGESTDDLVPATTSPRPPPPRTGFFTGIPSLQLPKIGLVGSRFSTHSSAAVVPPLAHTGRPIYNSGPRVASSVYPPTEYAGGATGAGYQEETFPFPMEPMPTYMPTGTTTTAITVPAAANEDARARRNVDRQRSRKHSKNHGHTNYSRKHGKKHGSNRTRQHGSSSSGNNSRRRHEQAGRHHETTAPSGAMTSSELSNSTSSTSTSYNEKAGLRNGVPRKRSQRSPPKPFLLCGPRIKSRRMRARILQVIVAAMLLVGMSVTYAGLALSNAVDPSQLTVPMAVIIGLGTVIVIWTVVRLFMLIAHKRNKSKNREMRRQQRGGDLEAGHRQQGSYTTGGFSIPREPIRVTLARDEEAAGIESGVKKVEPPAYGKWRETMRVDPNRIYWQRNNDTSGESSSSTHQQPHQPSPIADYANHPAMAPTPIVNSHHDAIDNNNNNNPHDTNMNYFTNPATVSDLGSSVLSAGSPNPSAVSSPSIVGRTLTHTHNLNNIISPSLSVSHPVQPTASTVPTTPWPRPPSYISEDGVSYVVDATPRTTTPGTYSDPTTEQRSNSYLAPPNPPPALMQLPSQISLFNSNLPSNRHEPTANDNDDDYTSVVGSEADALSILSRPSQVGAFAAAMPTGHVNGNFLSSSQAYNTGGAVYNTSRATRTGPGNGSEAGEEMYLQPATFQPAYYVPDPRDTRTYQAQQQQEYYIDIAAASAVTSRVASPAPAVSRSASRVRGGAGVGFGSRRGRAGMGVGSSTVAASDCGTIEVGITQSQYIGIGGSQLGSRGVVDDEGVYDDMIHEQLSDDHLDINVNTNGRRSEEVVLGEEEEEMYIDVEIDADQGGVDARKKSSKKRDGSRRERRRRERRQSGAAKVAQGTPLIGQLGGTNGWS